MKKDDLKRSDLEQDINQLRNSLNPIVGESRIDALLNKREEDKRRLKELKKEYKSKKFTKKSIIKNLAFTGKHSIWFIPLVLVPTIFGVGMGNYNAEHAKEQLGYHEDANYEEEYVYKDSFGNEIILEEDVYNNDLIRIETEYKKLANDGYMKNVYGFDDSIYNREELEKLVNTDYIELLNELGEPDYTDQIIEYNVDESNNNPKVSAIARIYNETEDTEGTLSFEEVLEKNHVIGDSVEIGLATALFAEIPMFFVWMALYFLTSRKIYNATWDNKLNHYEKVVRDAMKKDIKKLKKEIKRGSK